MPIHPTAIIDKKAEIDPTADIGPYVIIEGEVKVGPEVKVYTGAYLTGWTTIGTRCEIHPHAVIGHLPQDLHFEGSRSYCRIGEGTIIREHVSVHRGTQPDSETVVGENCFFLAGSHIGHNCQIGNNVTLINNAIIAGHVTIGDRTVISGLSGVHQFCRIGEMVMLSGASAFTMDVPSFMTASFRNTAVGINAVGMRRGGVSPEGRLEIKEAYKILFKKNTHFREAIDEVDEKMKTKWGRRLVDFLREPTQRGYIRANNSPRG